jgi:ubiquitin C-terminal hydrolase
LKGTLGLNQHFKSRAAFSPKKLVSRLGSIAPHFGRYRQEDAHELLRAVLDVSAGGFADEPIEALFKGTLRSTLTCPLCSFSSHSREPFFDLSVEPKASLKATIAAFTAEEKLGVSNRWRCGKCSKEVCATKQCVLVTIGGTS